MRAATLRRWEHLDNPKGMVWDDGHFLFPHMAQMKSATWWSPRRAPTHRWPEEVSAAPRHTTPGDNVFLTSVEVMLGPTISAAVSTWNTDDMAK